MKKIEKLDLTSYLKESIQNFNLNIKFKNVGRIIQIGDGVAKISGLSQVSYQELVQFDKNTFGLALNLEKDSVGVIILGDYQHLVAGGEVSRTGKILQIGVSDKLLGRVVDPLGRPLDGQPAVKPEKYLFLERLAPSVIVRESVDTPVQTGIKAIDSMIPIGRGQRELIIGDRATGKSAIPITTFINQKDQNMICIYVAIGQKQSFIAQTIATLEKFGAMDYTIIVAASASDPAAIQFLAPYAGCAIGEYFAEKGKDALIVYDDLSKHAWAYRELSLLLRRPSGREAYPGDIFYLHSRLLERACKYAKKYGGGSLTALPIIETQAGDLSAYIPTNVISITDGQIFLEADLFYNGIRPAINIGLSVSRVGGAAQIKAMKQVAGKLRLEMAAYRELAAFSQFSADLDPATKAQIERGKRITEILKQSWDEPYPVIDQVLIIFCVTNGFFDQISIENIKKAEKKLLEYLHKEKKKLLEKITKEAKLEDNTIEDLKKAIEKFLNSEGVEFVKEAKNETNNNTNNNEVAPAEKLTDKTIKKEKTNKNFKKIRNKKN
jgi:F-type H+-transporting ATPase subunit alpha